MSRRNPRANQRVRKLVGCGCPECMAKVAAKKKAKAVDKAVASPRLWNYRVTWNLPNV